MIIGTISPYATKNGMPNTIVGIQVVQCVVENSHRTRYVAPMPMARMNGETMKISNVANPRLRCRIWWRWSFPDELNYLSGQITEIK